MKAVSLEQKNIKEELRKVSACIIEESLVYLVNLFGQICLSPLFGLLLMYILISVKQTSTVLSDGLKPGIFSTPCCILAHEQNKQLLKPRDQYLF